MIRVWRYWKAWPKLIVFVAQGLLVAAVPLRAAWGVEAGSLLASIDTSPGFIAVLLACQLCFYLGRLDRLIVDASFKLLLVRTLKALGAGLILAELFFYLFPQLSPGYRQALAAALLSALLLLALGLLLSLIGRHRRVGERTLILGRGELAAKLQHELTNGSRPHEIEDPTTPSAAEQKRADGGARSELDRLREVVLREGICRIVLAAPDAPVRRELAAALVECRLRGVEVEDAATFYERLHGKVWLEAVHPEWLIYSEGFRASSRYMALKRSMDVIFALLLIIAAVPMLALIALAIRLESPGPVLFKQERVGLHGRSFVLYKFRSMRQDAERGTGPVWAGEQDERTTRLGRVLRKFRLDEIPQAYNVLRGEMSLVGPRPERPYFVDLLREHIPYYDLRHCVKPGITGWTQVNYPYGASIEDSYQKMQYDLYYIKNISLGLDLTILLKTVKVVIFGWGR